MVAKEPALICIQFVQIAPTYGPDSEYMMDIN
jgi:hypothetical protein